MSAIARTRERLRLSQDDLAALLGVHPMTVSKWERSVIRPTRYHRNLLICFRSAAVRRPEIWRELRQLLDEHAILCAVYHLIDTAFASRTPP